MTFRFLHTADWQLGRAYGQFPPELAGVLARARIDAVERIRDLARGLELRHVLVAGDVWDVEEPSDETLAQPLEIMNASGLHWWLLPGNHDPARPKGLWERVAERAGPTVHPLTEPEAVEVEPGVFVLPAPWTTKAPGRDLTEGFAERATPDGAIRIGLAHGGTVEFAADAVQSAAIAPGRAAEARLDYLALGDWHGHQRVDERTWYAGAPEADRFPKNRPGYVLEVEVAAGAPPRVTPHEVGRYGWRREALACRPGIDPAADLHALVADADARRTLLRLELSGEVDREGRAALDAALSDLSARLAHLRVRGDVRTAYAPEDLDGLDALGGSVRVAAERLMARIGDDALALTEREDARRALDLLHGFASQ